MGVLASEVAELEDERDHALSEGEKLGRLAVLAMWQGEVELLERLQAWVTSEPRPPFPWALQVALEETLRDSKSMREEFARNTRRHSR